jgi:hypothetical protein
MNSPYFKYQNYIEYKLYSQKKRGKRAIAALSEFQSFSNKLQFVIHRFVLYSSLEFMQLYTPV